MKRSLLLGLLIAGSTLMAACGFAAPAARELPAPSSAPAMPPQFALGGAQSSQESVAPSDALKAAGQVPADGNRLVIKTAELSIVVADVNARLKDIEDMAAVMGGFVVSANVYQTQASDGSSVPQAQIVVRVPQEKLDDAIAQIKKDTVEVQTETRAGQDVTDQYVDLQSRLTAKQAAEAQLLKIMQDATKTQDVLDVYAQLQQVQSDIEVLKGQIKYTEQAAALSAVSVNIIAEKTIKPLEVAGWKPQGVARDAIQSLIYFEQAFVDFLIRFALYTLPVLVTIGIPLYLVFLLFRWGLRKLRRPRVLSEPEEPKREEKSKKK